MRTDAAGTGKADPEALGADVGLGAGASAGAGADAVRAPSGAQALREAASVLREGRSAVFPTDTVYGLGVSVEAAESPRELYRIKERDDGKPIAWLVASPADLDRYGRDVPDFARVLALTFWPGPLTLVVKASDAVPPSFRSQAGTIGLRMPDNEMALALIEAVGCPVATTSANLSGHRAPRSFDALDPELLARAGAVLADARDAGKSGVASTVLDCTHGHPTMVREGSVTAASIRALA